MIRALFICSRNRLRSPTAEQIFAAWPGIETDSAGLSPDAETPLTPEQIDWASIIFVMENAHRIRLSRQFRKYLTRTRGFCLGIADDYSFMPPELIAAPEARSERFLR